MGISNGNCVFLRGICGRTRCKKNEKNLGPQATTVVGAPPLPEQKTGITSLAVAKKLHENIFSSEGLPRLSGPILSTYHRMPCCAVPIGCYYDSSSCGDPQSTTSGDGKLYLALSPEEFGQSLCPPPSRASLLPRTGVCRALTSHERADY